MKKRISNYSKKKLLKVIKNEYLFGNDNSEDQTDFEINKLSKKLIGYNIIKYQGPGVCKSENVYKGIENSTGEIIVIYDADLTVSFSDIEFSINILKQTNADFINCTRMIYPQKDGAMKFLNFIGNSFFASLFSVLFRKKLQILYVEQKYFTKRIGLKSKKMFQNGVLRIYGEILIY